jgi:tRNA dimethylallyltransferase
MKRVFFIVGPTATGKSELAADVAEKCDGEIVSADAFQIYRGLDMLTAKPGARLLAKAPHHLIGIVPATSEMNAEKFRVAALRAINEIHDRGNMAIVAGGSGLYIKAITHGLAPLPRADTRLREELHQLSLEQLNERLNKVDLQSAKTIDKKNKRRVIRALEICLLTGRPASAQRAEWNSAEQMHGGVFVFYERANLYWRVDRRVEEMFRRGVVEEVRTLGKLSATAEKTLGLAQIRQLLAGEITRAECISAIQQATRRYAKRQLTWFRRQLIFEPLDLSLLNDHNSAVDLILQKVSFAAAND